MMNTAKKKNEAQKESPIKTEIKLNIDNESPNFRAFLFL